MADRLHITDGESVAGTLRKSGVPGKISVYFDMLSEGPAPANLTADAFRTVRAGFFEDKGFARYLAWCDRTLATFPSYKEVVLWLDHRLSDQLILIKLLDWFSRQDLANTKLSLICTGSYPGKPDFVGFGQLTADQLASLADTRARVSDAEFCAGCDAWRAFTSPDPSDIVRLIQSETSTLPFLPAALHRHLEEFPSVDTGLSRTEQKILSLLREVGPLPPMRLFGASQRSEEQVFMGDFSFYRLLVKLASAQRPLIDADITDPGFGDSGPECWISTPIYITDNGLRVLAGDEDHIRLNGIDRWLGGVHLQGLEAIWRWDSTNLKLVRP